jgi:deoxyribodipyrimidine photolyase
VIHGPWRVAVRPAGYPTPILDHLEARERALARYRAVRTT